VEVATQAGVFPLTPAILRRRFMSRHRTAAAVAFAITAVCMGVFVWSLSPCMAQSEERERELQELAKKSQVAVTKITGLQFKSNVKIGVKQRADLKEMMIKQLDEEVPAQEMKDMHKALVKFRLLPADMDLGKFFVNMYTTAVEGFYDPETKELYLIGEKEQKKPETAEEKMMEMNKKMMEMMFGVQYDEMLLVHELTHAAQDQNFDMQTLPMDGQENDDLVSAIKSVIEGEATYSMFEHLFKKMGGVDRVGDMGKMLSNDPLTGGAGMQDAPEYIRQGMIFPYAKGFTFVQKLKKYAISQAPGQNSEEVAWAAIHKLYSDLPSSTEQILHPKKYFETRDNPTIVTLPDLSEVLGKEWRLLLSNVHGELNVGILLKEVLKERNVVKARNGWDGDRFAVFEKKDSPNVLAVWFTTWDTPQDAQEFFMLYSELIPAKYKEAGMLKIFEPGVNRWATDEGGVILEVRDCDVLAIEGTDGGIDEKLRETLWKNTKKAHRTQEKGKQETGRRG
jgi:hypothetical protein